MQIKDHANTSGLKVDPNKFVGVCARIRTSSQSLVQRLVSFGVSDLFVLSCIGSLTEPDAATITAETLALQKDADGIQLTSKAARFCVASQSA